MSTEIVYLGHDNSNEVILKQDGVAISLSGITKMTLTFGTKLISSVNAADAPIRWNKDGYGTGEVRFFLGGQTITAGDYHSVPLVVYDASYTNGLVWGLLDFSVNAEVEGDA